MQVKKKVIIGSVIVLAFLLITWAVIMRKPIKGIIIEEEITDLPQKPRVSLDTYMPIIKDTMWIYEDSTTPYVPISVWVDFIKDNIIQIRFKQGDKITAKVFIEEEEAIYEVATVEDATIKQDYTTLRQYNNIIMKWPIEVGSSWIMSDNSIRTITQTDGVYETELGEQTGIEMTTRHEDYTITETFVEKIGLYSIKYETPQKTRTIQFSEMISNKPQEEVVELYLMNKATGKMETVFEKVAVMTNEEPKHFLTDLLKKAPNEDYLIDISNGAIINKLFLDEEEACLYVEMSEDFIDPQYSKTEEEKIITSLVNTLGHYYNAEYVVMTVEGEAYPLKSPLNDINGRIKVKDSFY